MSTKEYVSPSKLKVFLDNLKNLFATKTEVANKADANHTHSDVTLTDSGFMTAEDKIKLNYGGIPIVSTSGDGSAYTATVNGVAELKIGMKLTIIPHTVSTTTTPTLNVNNLGAKYIRMPVAYNTSATSGGAVEEWLVDNKPVTLLYNGTYWITSSLPRTSAQYLYGAVPIENGGTGADNVTDARANLEVYSKAEIDALLGDINTILESLIG